MVESQFSTGGGNSSYNMIMRRILHEPNTERGTYSRRSLHGRLAHELGMQIVAGEIAVGTVLPTESELSAHYHVSRTALREAMKVLTAKGLMESRPRVGTRVRPRADWHLIDPDVIAWHCEAMPNGDFLCDLFEIQLIVEPNAAALAAERRTDGDLRIIEGALGDMARVAVGGDMAEPNLRFHTAVMAAANNPFLATMALLIEPASNVSVRLIWEHDPAAFSLATYRAVFEAIADGRGGMARRAMQSLMWILRGGLLGALGRTSTKERTPERPME